MQEHGGRGIGRRSTSIVVALSAICTLIVWSSSEPIPTSRRKPAAQVPKSGPANDVYGKLPLSFEENRGQTDSRVKFLARGNGYALFLTSTEAVLKLLEPPVSGAPRTASNQYSVVKIALKRANPRPLITGLDRLAGKSNYFIGSDRKSWWSDIPTFAAVGFHDVYPGIDLAYRGSQGRLEYDLTIAPGADPRTIEMEIEGARRLSIDAQGSLIIGASSGKVVQQAPLIFQGIGSQKRIVAGGYQLRGARTVTFKVGAYDRSEPLIIDPLFTYATYLGGANGDQANAIAIDSSDGSAWVTGLTGSVDFPVTSNAFQPSSFGQTDAFISKLNPTGTGLIYSTYAGGSDDDAGLGIAIDPAGNVYVTGATRSPDFPVSFGAFQTALSGTQSAFVIALDQGGALIYSTYVGGGTSSSAVSIAVDSKSNAFVAGTASAGFPTTPGAFQPSCSAVAPLICGFVTTLNPAGAALGYSTFVGVSDGGWPRAVALDASDNAYLIGGTASGTNYTGTSCAQNICASAVRLNSTGASLGYSDIFPSTALNGIATDSAGNARIVGFQGGNILLNVDPSGNASAVALNSGGHPAQIAIGPASGNLFLSGQAEAGLPTTPDAFQTNFGGVEDAFLTILDPTGTFTIYSTYLGGSGSDVARGLAVDSAENAYVTGFTASSDFPVTFGVVQGQHPAGNNNTAFVARIVPSLLSPSPTQTPQPTTTVGSTPVSTIMVPPSMTPSRTLLATRTARPTGIATVTVTRTSTPQATITQTVPATIIATPTVSATSGRTTTPTAIATTAMITPTATTIATPVSTGFGSTPTPTLTPTITATPTPTPTPVGPITIAPRELNFPAKRIGKVSAPKSLKVINPKSNQGAVVITGIALGPQTMGTGGFAIDSAKSSCRVGGSIARGKSCTVAIVFAPTSKGTFSGSLIITGNVTNSGQPVVLTGRGLIPGPSQFKSAGLSKFAVVESAYCAKSSVM